MKDGVGGRKGELVAAIGCGTNRLDSAERVSNATWIRDKLRCFLGQD